MLYVTFRDGFALVTCCRCLNAVPRCAACHFGPFADDYADLAVDAVAGMLRRRGFRVATG
jgi:hypothetical protein